MKIKYNDYFFNCNCSGLKYFIPLKYEEISFAVSFEREYISPIISGLIECPHCKKKSNTYFCEKDIGSFKFSCIKAFLNQEK